jgi:hypothetical protein
VLAEDLEQLLRLQLDAERARFHRPLQCGDHAVELQPAVGQQPVLAAEVVEGLHVGVVEERGDRVELHAETPVDEDPLQALEVRVVVQAVPRGRAAAGREQPDLVVVVQGAHGDARDAGDLPDGQGHGDHLLRRPYALTRREGQALRHPPPRA